MSRLSTPDDRTTVTAAYQPGADVVDATIGIALALTLGAGARGFLRNLLANLL